MAIVPSPKTALEPQVGTRTGSKTQIGGGSGAGGGRGAVAEQYFHLPPDLLGEPLAPLFPWGFK